MSRNKKFAVKIATMLLTYAVIIPLNTSMFLVGEPKLPKKMTKDDTVKF